MEFCKKAKERGKKDIKGASKDVDLTTLEKNKKNSA